MWDFSCSSSFDGIFEISKNRNLLKFLFQDRYLSQSTIARTKSIFISVFLKIIDKFLISLAEYYVIQNLIGWFLKCHHLVHKWTNRKLHNVTFNQSNSRPVICHQPHFIYNTYRSKRIQCLRVDNSLFEKTFRIIFVDCTVSICFISIDPFLSYVLLHSII